jgi:hypothetical protein
MLLGLIKSIKIYSAYKQIVLLIKPFEKYFFTVDIPHFQIEAYVIKKAKIQLPPKE